MKLKFESFFNRLKSGDFFYLVAVLFNGTIIVLLFLLFWQNAVAPSDEDVMRKENPEYYVSSTEIPLGSFSYVTKDLKNTESDKVQIFEFDASVVPYSAEVSGKAFSGLMRKNKGRIEQMMEEVIRSSNDEDFGDPDLSAIRGKMTNGINEITGEKVINDLQFSHFRHFRVDPKTSLQLKQNWDNRINHLH